MSHPQTTPPRDPALDADAIQLTTFCPAPNAFAARSSFPKILPSPHDCQLLRGGYLAYNHDQWQPLLDAIEKSPNQGNTVPHVIFKHYLALIIACNYSVEGAHASANKYACVASEHICALRKQAGIQERNDLQFVLMCYTSIQIARGKHIRDPILEDGHFLDKFYMNWIHPSNRRQSFTLTKDFVRANLWQIISHARRSRDVKVNPFDVHFYVNLPGGGLQVRAPFVPIAPKPEPKTAEQRIKISSDPHIPPRIPPSRMQKLAKLPRRAVPDSLPPTWTTANATATASSSRQSQPQILNPFAAAARGDVSDLAMSMGQFHVDGRDERGLTPLMYAAMFGQMGTVQLLVECGAGIGRRGPEEWFMNMDASEMAGVKGFVDVRDYLRVKDGVHYTP